VFVVALGIGIVAGLRSFTAPAAVSWGAHLGRIKLTWSGLVWVQSALVAGSYTLLALLEFAVDLWPKAPNRTAPASLMTRILMGSLSGACISMSGGGSAVLGGVLGAIGGIVGAFAGYEARTRLVRGLKVKDVMIAVPEDLLAIGLAYAIVFLG
jgi:uncharacterized membrane protein